MVMDRSHKKDSFFSTFVPEDLNHYRQSLNYKYNSDNGEQKLLFYQYGNGSEKSTESQGAGITHKNFGRRTVKPQKAEAGTDGCRADDAQILERQNVIVAES